LPLTFFASGGGVMAHCAYLTAVKVNSEGTESLKYAMVFGASEKEARDRLQKPGYVCVGMKTAHPTFPEGCLVLVDENARSLSGWVSNWHKTVDAFAMAFEAGMHHNEGNVVSLPRKKATRR